MNSPSSTSTPTTVYEARALGRIAQRTQAGTPIATPHNLPSSAHRVSTNIPTRLPSDILVSTLSGTLQSAPVNNANQQGTSQSSARSTSPTINEILDWHTPSPPPSLVFGDAVQQANETTITVEQFEQIRNLIRDQGIRIAAVENTVNRSQGANVSSVPLLSHGIVDRGRRGRNQGRKPRVRTLGQQELQPDYNNPIRSVAATRYFDRFIATNPYLVWDVRYSRDHPINVPRKELILDAMHLSASFNRRGNQQVINDFLRNKYQRLRRAFLQGENQIDPAVGRQRHRRNERLESKLGHRVQMMEAYCDIVEWPADLQPVIDDCRNVLTAGYTSTEESDEETPGARRAGTRVPGQRTRVRVREPAGGRTDEIRRVHRLLDLMYHNPVSRNAQSLRDRRARQLDFTFEFEVDTSDFDAILPQLQRLN